MIVMLSVDILSTMDGGEEEEREGEVMMSTGVGFLIQGQ